jgi:hypothetical protein
MHACRLLFLIYPFRRHCRFSYSLASVLHVFSGMLVEVDRVNLAVVVLQLREQARGLDRGNVMRISSPSLKSFHGQKICLKVFRPF